MFILDFSVIRVMQALLLGVITLINLRDNPDNPDNPDNHKYTL